MIVVADASPVLHLARIGRLDLVVSAVGPAIIPPTVWSELIQAGTRRDVVEALRAATWIQVMDDPPLEDLGLDPGETAAILLAERLSADALVMDERRGRGVAASRGIGVVGTLGMLAGAKRAGALDRWPRWWTNSGRMDSGEPHMMPGCLAEPSSKLVLKPCLFDVFRRDCRTPVRPALGFMGTMDPCVRSHGRSGASSRV